MSEQTSETSLIPQPKGELSSTNEQQYIDELRKRWDASSPFIFQSIQLEWYPKGMQYDVEAPIVSVRAWQKEELKEMGYEDGHFWDPGRDGKTIEATMVLGVINIRKTPDGVSLEIRPKREDGKHAIITFDKTGTRVEGVSAQEALLGLGQLFNEETGFNRDAKAIHCGSETRSLETYDPDGNRIPKEKLPPRLTNTAL